jgi:2-iminobutanoate/2-iminopropanoate deaminase
MPLTHIDPEALPANPAFSHGVRISGPGDLLVVGGQNGIDSDGAVVGDARAQSAQALRNVLTVLAAAGATQADVARLTVYIVGDTPIDPLYAAAQEVWGPNPTAIAVVRVAGLGNPDWLVEVEALAQVPATS